MSDVFATYADDRAAVDAALLRHLPPVQMKDGWRVDANGDIVTSDHIVSRVRLSEAQYAMEKGVAPAGIAVDRLASMLSALFETAERRGVMDEHLIADLFQSYATGTGAVCRCLLDVRRAAA